MGWTVLYIAFGAVALWLLGEVLLQYKARLRWRLLAFFGFGTVVVGVVLLSSVVVIGLGAVAFAVGQTLVTLSYRKGFVAGWALDGLPGLPDLPGLSRRRDDEDGHEYEHAGRAPESGGDAEPSPEVSELQEQQAYGQQDIEPPAYEPQPLPDETGEYGVYGREQNVFTGQPDYQEQYGYPEQQPYQEQQAGYGQEAYAAYSDPYIGYGYGGQPAAASYEAGYGAYDATYAAGYPAQPDDPYAAAAAGYPAAGYDQGGYDQAGFDQQAVYAQTGYPQGGYDDGSGYGGYGDGSYPGYDAGYPAGQDPYAAQPGYDGTFQQATPAEGVWVPQPREGDDPYRTQSAQGYYPYQDGYGYYTDQRGGY